MLAFLGRVFPVALAAACVIALIAGCGSSGDSVRNAEGGRNTLAAEEVTEFEIPTRWASGNARDLPTLVRSTGTIFVGEVTSLQRQRLQQLGGDTGPISNGDGVEKPAPRGSAAFPISQYEIRVERSLAGGLVEGSTVVVEQVSGVVTSADGSPTRIILEGDEPLEVGTRYLFFASVKPNGNLTSPPFARFVVGANGSLSPLDTWAGLPVAEGLAGLSVEQASSEVRTVGP